MKLDELPTPAIVIDVAVVQHNIDRLQAYADQHRLGVRPHTKTHKSRRFAAMQMQAGAIGLTVAKVGEAEVLQNECDDLLIAYPAADPGRVGRMAELAKQKTLHVAVDSITAIDALANAASRVGSTIGVLIEVDVGMKRTGVATSELALELARHVERSPGTQLDGIMCYPGHIWTPVDQQASQLKAVSAVLEQTIDVWKRSGCRPRSSPAVQRRRLISRILSHNTPKFVPAPISSMTSTNGVVAIVVSTIALRRF